MGSKDRCKQIILFLQVASHICIYISAHDYLTWREFAKKIINNFKELCMIIISTAWVVGRYQR